MSDIKIIYGGFLFFVVLSLILTFVNREFDQEYEDVDFNELEDTTSSVPKTSISIASSQNFFVNLLKAASYSFGQIPFLLELIMIFPIRVVFWVTLIRQLLGSGN